MLLRGTCISLVSGALRDHIAMSSVHGLCQCYVHKLLSSIINKHFQFTVGVVNLIKMIQRVRCFQRMSRSFTWWLCKWMMTIYHELSKDKTVNEYGKVLLALCRATEMRIVNAKCGVDNDMGKLYMYKVVVLLICVMRRTNC